MSEEQNTEPVETKPEPPADAVEPKADPKAEAPVGNSGATLADALAGAFGNLKLEAKPAAAAEPNKAEQPKSDAPPRPPRPEGQRPPRPQGGPSSARSPSPG